jgi:hypothetical protein
MRKITMTLAAAIFVVGSVGLANAQTQGASSLNAQAQNATRPRAAVGAAGARPVAYGAVVRIAAGALPAGEPKEPRFGDFCRRGRLRAASFLWS